MNRKEFQTLALERLEDARALLKAKRYAGAYYLAGYGVECALKACIARQTRRSDFPPKDTNSKHYTHQLATLLTTAGLSTKLAGESSNARLQANWAIAKNWNAEARYRRLGRIEAQELIAAITDDVTGVLQWLKKYW